LIKKEILREKVKKNLLVLSDTYILVTFEFQIKINNISQTIRFEK